MTARTMLTLLTLTAASASSAEQPVNVTILAPTPIELPPPPTPCSEAIYGRSAGAERHDYRDHPTGAWDVHGHRVRSSGYFSISMRDTNPAKKDFMHVRLLKDSDVVTISVRSFGSAGAEESLDGEKWRSESTSGRARIAKAALIRLAEQAAKACGGRISTLAEEIETFDKAFPDFDRYR